MLTKLVLALGDYSSSVTAEKSWVSRKAEMTAASLDSVGSIWVTLAMFTKRRLTPCRLPKKEYTRCRASTSSAATMSLVNA